MSRHRAPSARSRPTTWHGVDFAESGRVNLLVRGAVFAIFFFPSSMVIDAIGASGTIPIMLAVVLLALWVASWVWGLHDPVAIRHPGRLAATMFILTSLVSYVALYLGLTPSSTPTSRAAADRWLISLFAMLGLVLVLGESVRTLGDAVRLTRTILNGAFFCCLVAVVQFTLHVNPMEWIQSAMVGFSYNGGDTPFQMRGNFVRVAGSTFHSIEMAVVLAMLLPLSIWRLTFDPVGRKRLQFFQTALLVFAIAATVSRSGMLGTVSGLAVALPFFPARFRRTILSIAPIVVCLLFVTIPGFVGTLIGALGADSSDPSIATRLNNYPRVARLFEDHPWVGLGPGNYVARNALEILDNQYLGSLVGLGITGLVGLLIYFLFPAITSLHAARTARSAPLRALAGALSAGLFVAAVCSLTFDSLSFPVFALIYPTLVGFAGGVWLLVRDEQSHGEIHEFRSKERDLTNG